MEQSGVSYKWWTQKSNTKTADSIFAFLKYLDNDQGYKTTEAVKFMRLYGNMEMLASKNMQLARDSGPALLNRVTLNVVQNMIDTVVSKIGKNKPRPMFLTEGGDFSQQRRAKKLSQFIEGQFDAMNFYDLGVDAFLNSCIFGTGYVKIFRNGNEVCAENVFPDEIKIDDREALYGRPRQLHQIKYIHKDVLKGMFPESATYIEAATNNNFNSNAIGMDMNKGDMLLTAESWRLPSSTPEQNEDGTDKPGDGKHTISIPGHVLFEEEYRRDYFPFVEWRWGKRPLGYLGQGIAEQLQGLQLEINKILRTIQVSMHLVSVPKLFVEMGSKVVDAHLDNRIGSIIRFAGKQPQPGQLGVIPKELFDHLDRLYQRAYEIIGISQLSASSQKPAGLDSGKALREYNDLETERFMSVAQRYEKSFITAVPMIIDLIKEIDSDIRQSDSGGFRVKVKGKKFINTIKWKDVDLDADQYVMSVFPTSALSSTPAGRLQDIQELTAAGFIGREDAIKLLDFPDLQAFYNFETAPGEDIDMCIEKIVEDGEYTTPEPYQDLQAGIQKMQKAYLLFRSQNCPESKLELFRRWIEDANALLERAAVDTQRQTMEAQAAVQQAGQEALEASAPAPGSMLGGVEDTQAGAGIVPPDPLQVQ